MKTLVKEHKSRTGWGPIALARLLPDINIHRIMHVLNTEKAVTIDLNEYDAIIEAYEGITEENYRNSNCRRASDDRVPISPSVLDIIDLLSNLQIGIPKLLARSNPPDGLTAAVISNIRNGRSQTIKIEHLRYLEGIAAGLRRYDLPPIIQSSF